MALHQAKVPAARGQVAQLYRGLPGAQRAKQRQAFAQQHGDAGDGDFVEQARHNKRLQGQASIHVQARLTLCRCMSDEFGRGAFEELHTCRRVRKFL